MQELCASLPAGAQPPWCTTSLMHESDTIQSIGLLFTQLLKIGSMSRYIPLSPALSVLSPTTPMFMVQIHDGHHLPSESPINASKSPQISSALRMCRVSFQSGTTSGSESDSITSWDVQYFSAALLTFAWHLLITILAWVLCQTPRMYLSFWW